MPVSSPDKERVMQEIFDNNGNYQGMKTTDLLGNDILVDAKGEYKGIFMKDLLGNDTFVDKNGDTTIFTKDALGNDAAWGPDDNKGIITKDLLGNTVFKSDHGSFLIRDLFPRIGKRSDDRPAMQSAAALRSGSSASPAPPPERSLLSSRKLTDRYTKTADEHEEPSMTAGQMQRYAVFAATALKKGMIPFDMQAENVRYVEHTKSEGFLGLKKTRIKERIVDAFWDCWLVERTDNIYSDGTARTEESIFYILTSDGTMMKGTETEVIEDSRRKLIPPVWEPCIYPSAKMLDLFLKHKGISFDPDTILKEPG